MKSPPFLSKKTLKKLFGVEVGIERICNACSCNETEAQEYLESEINNLRELRDLDDLLNSDIESACSGLGLDFDYMAYFIEALAS